MNKFLKSVRSSANNKDDLIKKAILSQFSQSVKIIHYCAVEENKNSKENDLLDAANTLATIIEALFLHGVKGSLTHRFRRVLSDLDERPEPNFWSALLVISHRQIIDQVMALSQINTEVGQCRAWVRIVLNDSLLSSYLMTMRQDKSILKSFYRTTAFLQDSELLDVAQRLVEGIESFKSFSLPCNSSLLNTWSVESLVLAGLWVPALKASPVAPCDDVAQTITENMKAQAAAEAMYDNVSLNSSISWSSQASSSRQTGPLTEDEILKIILSKSTETNSTTRHSSNGDRSVKNTITAETRPSSDNINCSVGNQLNRGAGWSFDEESQVDTDESVQNKEPDIKEKEVEKVDLKDESKSAEASYRAVIDSYSMLSGGYIRTPDIKEVWEKYNSEINEQQSIMDNNNVQPDNRNTTIIINVIPDPTDLEQYITRVANERGLDSQNFECSSCKHSLGIAHKPNVCAFTGEYFCDSCMSDELIPIPARIIHNWDFRPYPVSKKAAEFIGEVKNDPLIDFKVVNPYIYGAVDQMAILQSLRTQLSFLRAYLYTCREPVIEELQKQMWPREYLYEHIHQYSISDLSEIQSNELVHKLEMVIVFGREHVMGCWLCSQKGFLCEICKKPKTLFPFDVQHVYRCDGCSAVFHKGCQSATNPCPKCDRKKKREELSILDIQV